MAKSSPAKQHIWPSNYRRGGLKLENVEIANALQLKGSPTSRKSFWAVFN